MISNIKLQDTADKTYPLLSCNLIFDIMFRIQRELGRTAFLKSLMEISTAEFHQNKIKADWAGSSAGRALGSQSRGQGFDHPSVHFI